MKKYFLKQTLKYFTENILYITNLIMIVVMMMWIEKIIIK